eukprot:3135863-Pleurochrysis_carterae.AAC.1
MLCRVMGCPTPELLLAAHRVLAYLHHHKNVGTSDSATSFARTALFTDTQTPTGLRGTPHRA